MKKILVITYVFPPAGGVMVQRVLKFVKYLPHFGWQPTVLTVRNPDYKMFSPELLKDVPKQTRIIRTGTLEPSQIRNFCRSWFNRIKFLLPNKKTRADRIDLDPAPKQSLLTKLNTFIFVPDNRVGWLPFASLAILTQLRKHSFDAIFSTSPPFSVHLVGMVAKHFLKKPWMVDFRDLWVLNPHIKPSTKIHLRISKYIEHKVLGFADKILTVSEPLGEDLKKFYPDIVPEKFSVIPNGYDAEDFGSKSDMKRNKGFSIGHIGSLEMYSGRTPYHLLKALAELKKEVPHLGREMSVFFVGAVDRPNKRIINEIVSKFGLRNMVHCTDYVPHSQAIGYMKSLSVLLFIIVESHKGCGSNRGNISGKLYEYLATGKPVLALTEDGPIRDLIKKSGCGILVDYDDIEKIKKEILTCYNKHKEGQLKVYPNWDFITQFERKTLTGQLANRLNELSQTEPNPQ